MDTNQKNFFYIFPNDEKHKKTISKTDARSKKNFGCQIEIGNWQKQKDSNLFKTNFKKKQLDA